MINSEETIGKVLAGLRDAEASPGLERRILDAVEARASARQVATPRWTWGVAMAGVVAVCLVLAITAIHRHENSSTQVRHSAVPADSLSANRPEKDTQVASLLLHDPIAPIRTVAQVRKAQPIITEDAVLLLEMRAPSHPAPAAPLTKEEKLLLRAIHTGNPQVTAMLDPEERARQDEESEAEFQKFVEQSGKEDNESNPITE
jgi:cell division protein FtsN